MKIKESYFWWGAVFICAIPTIVRLLNPTAVTILIFPAIQQCAFGIVVSIATGAAIVARYSKKEGYVDPKKFVAKQKLVATILGALILGPILIYAAITERFQEFGGWILLPVSFIGPILYLRDIVFRKGLITNNDSRKKP